MKNLNKMTADQLINLADKTIKSLVKCNERDRNPDAQFTGAFVKRHAELKERLQDFGVWNKFCKSRDLSPSHEAFDFFC